MLRFSGYTNINHQKLWLLPPLQSVFDSHLFFFQSTAYISVCFGKLSSSLSLPVNLLFAPPLCVNVSSIQLLLMIFSLIFLLFLEFSLATLLSLNLLPSFFWPLAICNLYQRWLWFILIQTIFAHKFSTFTTAVNF